MLFDYRMMVHREAEILDHKRRLTALREQLDGSTGVLNQLETADNIRNVIGGGAPPPITAETFFRGLIERYSVFDFIVLKPFICRYLLSLYDGHGGELRLCDVEAVIRRLFSRNAPNQPSLPAHECWENMRWDIVAVAERTTEVGEPFHDLEGSSTKTIFYIALAHITGLLALTSLYPWNTEGLLLQWIRDIWDRKGTIVEMRARGDSSLCRILEDSLVRNYKTVPDLMFDRACQLLIDYFAARAYHGGPGRYLQRVARVARWSGRAPPGRLSWDVIDLIANFHEHPREERAFREMGLQQMLPDLVRDIF